jgi:hypothetical protein
MPARKKRDLGPFESLVADVRRHGREAEELEGRLTKALNEAYMQGARDARKAISGVDPKVEGRCSR